MGPPAQDGLGAAVVSNHVASHVPVEILDGGTIIDTTPILDGARLAPAGLYGTVMEVVRPRAALERRARKDAALGLGVDDRLPVKVAWKLRSSSITATLPHFIEMAFSLEEPLFCSEPSAAKEGGSRDAVDRKFG